MNINLTPTAHSMEVINRSTLEFDNFEDLKAACDKFDYSIGDIVKIRSNGKIEYRELSETIDLDSILWERSPGVTVYWNLVEVSSRKYTFGTIEEMKKAKYLKVGDVVEIHDIILKIPHHFRVVDSLNRGGDILDNGLYSNVSYQGEVNLDCYTDITSGFENAYKDDTVSKIIAMNPRTIKITKSLSRSKKLDIDLGGSIFYYDLSNFKTVLKFEHDATWKAQPKVEIVANPQSIRYPIFKDYPDDVVIKITDSVPWTVRVGDHASNSYRCDINYKKLIDTMVRPFYTDYTSSDSHTIYTRSPDQYSSWSNFEVFIDVPKDTIQSVELFTIKRDNFKFKDLKIKSTRESMTTPADSSIFRGSIFGVYDSFNVFLENIDGTNFIGLKPDGTRTGRSGYIFGMGDIVNLHMKHVYLDGGWGAFGTNRMFNVTMEDSVVNRWDSHTYSADWSFNRCSFFLHGLNYPEMYGDLRVSNSKFYECGIRCRSDYNVSFPVKMILENVDFVKGGIYHHMNELTQYRGGQVQPQLYLDNVNFIDHGTNKPINISGERHTFTGGVVSLNRVNFIGTTKGGCELGHLPFSKLRITDSTFFKIENQCMFETSHGTSGDQFSQVNQIYGAITSYNTRYCEDIFIDGSTLAIQLEDPNANFKSIDIYNSKICFDFTFNVDASYEKVRVFNSDVFMIPYKTKNEGIDHTNTTLSYGESGHGVEASFISNCRIMPMIPKHLASYIKKYRTQSSTNYGTTFLNCTIDYIFDIFEDTYYTDRICKEYWTCQKYQNFSDIFPITESPASLDTPIYTSLMKKEGVYEDFETYMFAKLEYDAQQREVQAQQQAAFEQREDQNQTYEEWMSSYPMLLPAGEEPQPSEALVAFKTKYLG